jgi:hypothetical protein
MLFAANKSFMLGVVILSVFTLCVMLSVAYAECKLLF